MQVGAESNLKPRVIMLNLTEQNFGTSQYLFAFEGEDKIFLL